MRGELPAPTATAADHCVYCTRPARHRPYLTCRGSPTLLTHFLIMYFGPGLSWPRVPCPRSNERRLIGGGRRDWPTLASLSCWAHQAAVFALAGTQGSAGAVLCYTRDSGLGGVAERCVPAKQPPASGTVSLAQSRSMAGTPVRRDACNRRMYVHSIVSQPHWGRPDPCWPRPWGGGREAALDDALLQLSEGDTAVTRN